MYKIRIRKNSKIKEVRYYNENYEFLEIPNEKEIILKSNLEFNINKNDILSFVDDQLYFETENSTIGYYVSYKDIDVLNEKGIPQTRKKLEKLVRLNINL